MQSVHWCGNKNQQQITILNHKIFTHPGLTYSILAIDTCGPPFRIAKCTHGSYIQRHLQLLHNKAITKNTFLTKTLRQTRQNKMGNKSSIPHLDNTSHIYCRTNRTSKTTAAFLEIIFVCL